MTRSVKLSRLVVKNVGTLTGTIDIGPFSPGINVISGTNEAGKSTLIQALRCALFERHSTKNRKILGLQPHGTKLAPEVQVELSLDGEVVSIHKRFLEKPMAEVRLERSSTVYRDKDADELLRDRLAGRSPKKGGVEKSDMGVWGLLWVTQDESAHTDPGEELDTEVRGAIAEVVGRQVGKVTGGLHGERIRAKSQQVTAQFFTLKTEVATGEFRRAIERREAADKRAAQIEQAVREVEELSERYHDEKVQLAEVEREIPIFEAELEAARQEARALEEREARARGTAAQLDAAKATHEARQRDVTTRAVTAKEAADAAVDVEKQRQHLDEMKRLLEERARNAEEAREALTQGQARLTEHRRALEKANERLARTHAHAEAARLAESLKKAQSLTEKIEAVDLARAEDGLEPPIYDEMQRLVQQIEVLRTKLGCDGTRLVARSPAREERVWVAATRTEITLPELGTVELSPARPGLAQAVTRLKEARATLREALFGLGVDDALQARERRATRAEAESEAAALQEQIEELAPKGVERLAERAATARAEHRRVEENLARAATAQAELDRTAREIAGYPIDARMLEALRTKARQAVTARAAHDALGTELTVRARKGVRVSLGDEPAELVTAGADLKRTIVTSTTLRIGDAAEIVLVPRGEDLVKAAARLERADHDLASALRAHGVETLERAEAIAEKRGELEMRKARQEERLADAAPKGVDALRAEVEKRRQAAQDLDTKWASSREALERLSRIEGGLAENRMTKEAIERIATLDRDVTRREGEVEKRSARLRAITGPLAERLGTEPQSIREAKQLAALGEGVWEVIPGESAEGGDLFEAERTLEEALKRARVPDFATATERWKIGLAQRDQRTRLEEHLELVAPEGLEALRARCQAAEQARRAGGPADQVAEVSATDLGPAIESLRSSLAGAEATLLELERASAKKDGERAACEKTVSELRGQWMMAQSAMTTASEKLVSLRSVVSDAVLEERLSKAAATLHTAQEADEREQRALAAATPDLLRDDVTRAEETLKLRNGEVRKLRDEVIHLKTLLDKAAAEGRFEELSDAKAEQAEAIDALGRIEREARAAQLLSSVIDDAYKEAQRAFLVPVLNEASPYLTKLRPGTELRMTPDLRLEKVLHREVEEDFDQLSGGTREQLAVIVRIALALVFAKDGRPLPLILDDTLGWTDDRRFLSMVQILRDAAQKLQMILLTCHGSRFDRLKPDFRVDLDELKRASSALSAAGGARAAARPGSHA